MPLPLFYVVFHMLRNKYVKSTNCSFIYFILQANYIFLFAFSESYHSNTPISDYIIQL